MKLKLLLTGLVCMAVMALAQGPSYPYSVVLSWTAPTTGTPPTGYNLYRAPYASSTCGTYVVQNTTALTTTTYTDSSVTPGNQYCYEVTALVGTAESGPDVLASNPVSLPPAPPTGLGEVVK
jgi:Fibronectin type III domain